MNEQERHESTQDTVLEGWSTWSEWLAQSGRPVERGKFLHPRCLPGKPLRALLPRRGRSLVATRGDVGDPLFLKAWGLGEKAP